MAKTRLARGRAKTGLNPLTAELEKFVPHLARELPKILATEKSEGREKPETFTEIARLLTARQHLENHPVLKQIAGKQTLIEIVLRHVRARELAQLPQGTARLSPEKIKAIQRDWLASGRKASLSKLAAKHGTYPTTVQKHLKPIGYEPKRRM